MEFVVAVFRDAGLCDGEYDLHVLGLLQHLSFGRGDSQSGEKYSAGNIFVDYRDCGVVPGYADEHFGSTALAASAGLAVYRQRVHREVVWKWRGEVCDG